MVSLAVFLVVLVSVVAALGAGALTVDVVVLAVAFVVILAGAELFTNGIEWFGRKLHARPGRGRLGPGGGRYGAARRR